MSATKRDLIIEQGATWNDVLTWKTGDPPVPVDLSGYTARMQVRATIDSPTTILDLTPTLGGPSGTITTSLTAAQTAALEFAGAPNGFVSAGTDSSGKQITASGPCAVYDLELTSGSTVIRLTQGIVCLSKEVTR